MGFIEYHHSRYKIGKKRIDLERENIFRFEEAKDRMINEKINGFKYNYALDEVVQDQTNYECELSLSKNGEELIVMLYKITE